MPKSTGYLFFAHWKTWKYTEPTQFCTKKVPAALLAENVCSIILFPQVTSVKQINSEPEILPPRRNPQQWTTQMLSRKSEKSMANSSQTGRTNGATPHSPRTPFLTLHVQMGNSGKSINSEAKLLFRRRNPEQWTHSQMQNATHYVSSVFSE